ncbi:MAG: glycosyltransferase family 9 protein [Acidobacteriota bacterium]
MIDMSVVIGTRNQEASLARTLESFARQTWPANGFEIVVVDSESLDGTPGVCTAERYPFTIRYIRRFDEGKSKARNVGIAAATGPFVLLTDSDVTAHPALVERHVAAQRDFPGSVVVGQQFMVDSPDAERLGARPCLNPTWRRGRRLTWRQFVTGNASLSRRRLEEVGGFDECFTGYGYEDYELGYRLAARGTAIVFEPGAVNFHYHPVALGDDLVRREQAGRAAVLFARRHPAVRLRLHLGLTPWNRGLYRWFPPPTLGQLLLRLSTRDSAIGRTARHLLLESAFHRGAMRAMNGYEHACARRDRSVTVTWWAAPAWAPILQNHPFIQRVWAPSPSAPAWALLGEMRASGFDAAILPWTTGRQVLLTAMAGIPRRIGQAGRLAYSWLLTDSVRVRSALGDCASHWTDIQLDYARALGCHVGSLVPRLQVTDADESAARRVLGKFGVRPCEAYCVLHVGKGLPIDDVPWPCQRFIEIGRALWRRYGWHVILTGSAQEARRVGEVEAGIGASAVNLAGRTSLRTLAGILAKSVACVAVDSGPMHVAAALGVRVVGLFAIKGDVVARWRPSGPCVRVVGTAGWSCARTCVKERCPDYECLGHIATAEVLAAVDELAGRAEPRSES